MSKLNKLGKAIKIAQETLLMMETLGIDVDRLIGISNAQGPLAKMIKAVMIGAIDLDDPEINDAIGLLPAPSKKKPQKARGVGSGSTKRQRSKNAASEHRSV